MRRAVAPVVAAAMALAISAAPGEAAQAGTALTETAAPPTAAATTEGGVVTSFLRDVGTDYLHFFSRETGAWLGAAGIVALGVHPVDKNLSDWAVEDDPTLTGGATYGSQWLHIPVAMGLWAIGAAAGSGPAAATGRDLLRAQISVVSWTYAIKLAADRTRPNGDPHSFPSGHASTSFATAAVLHEHFGWKVGVPAFAVAAYTAASRVAANQHWASDVVFGAAVGLASGRTVTIQLRETRLSLGLLAVPGGGGVLVNASR